MIALTVRGTYVYLMSLVLRLHTYCDSKLNISILQREGRACKVFKSNYGICIRVIL